MEPDLAAIASRAERHASEPRYRAEDLVYEAWEAAGPRRAVLARKALALWPDCADGYALLAQEASSLEEARALLGEARELNPHIASYLTGRKKLPRKRPAYRCSARRAKRSITPPAPASCGAACRARSLGSSPDPRTSGSVHRVSRGMVHSPRGQRAGCRSGGR
jgi:hypothetical protein